MSDSSRPHGLQPIRLLCPWDLTGKSTGVGCHCLLPNSVDMGSTPGLGRSPSEGNSNPLQYFCLKNPMDGGAWWTTIHGVKKSVGLELATKQQYSTVYMYHIFFIHSSVNGHEGCFHVLAIINSSPVLFTQ